MAGTINITKILDRMNTAAAGVTGVTASSEGKKVYADNENKEADVLAQDAEIEGIFACWLMNRRATNGQTGSGTANYGASLAIKLPKDTTTDSVAMCEFVESVFQALMQESTYRTAGARPTDGEYQILPQDDDPEDDIVEVAFALTFTVGPLCGSL